MKTLLTVEEFALNAASLTWTFAKTMTWIPHWYIVRGKTCRDDNLYVSLFNTIHALGCIGHFGKTERKYLHPGDGYKYWAMTEDITESVIINRAKET